MIVRRNRDMASCHRATRLTASTLPAGPVGGPQRLAHAKGVPSSTWRKATNESKTCRTPPSCSSPTEKPPVRTPMTGIFSFAAACASKILSDAHLYAGDRSRPGLRHRAAGIRGEFCQSYGVIPRVT